MSQDTELKLSLALDKQAAELAEAKAELAKVKAELLAWTGPRCVTADAMCEDYDGSHPFHQNAIEVWWHRRQEQDRARGIR